MTEVIFVKAVVAITGMAGMLLLFTKRNSLRTYQAFTEPAIAFTAMLLLAILVYSLVGVDLGLSPAGGQPSVE
jgi:nitrate reductase gamma subunit